MELAQQATLQSKLECKVSSLLDSAYETETSASGDEERADEAELAMARTEKLLERRGLLQSNSLLRQNPNNVQSRMKRAELAGRGSDSFSVVKTFAEAVTTVDPLKAMGRASELWIKFGQFHEAQGQLAAAN